MRFRIQGLDKKTLGYVSGKNKGAAMQAAVNQGLVTGRKKIGAMIAQEENDPYEQSWNDIYGTPKARKKAA